MRNLNRKAKEIRPENKENIEREREAIKMERGLKKMKKQDLIELVGKLRGELAEANMDKDKGLKLLDTMMKEKTTAEEGLETEVEVLKKKLAASERAGKQYKTIAKVLDYMKSRTEEELRLIKNKNLGEGEKKNDNNTFINKAHESVYKNFIANLGMGSWTHPSNLILGLSLSLGMKGKDIEKLWALTSKVIHMTPKGGRPSEQAKLAIYKVYMPEKYEQEMKKKAKKKAKEDIMAKGFEKAKTANIKEEDCKYMDEEEMIAEIESGLISEEDVIYICDKEKYILKSDMAAAAKGGAK